MVILPSPLHLGLADFRQHNMQDQSETAPCLRIGKWASVTSRLSTGVAGIGEFEFETKCPVSPTPLHRLCTLENQSECRGTWCLDSPRRDSILPLPRRFSMSIWHSAWRGVLIQSTGPSVPTTCLVKKSPAVHPETVHPVVHTEAVLLSPAFRFCEWH